MRGVGGKLLVCVREELNCCWRKIGKSCFSLSFLVILLSLSLVVEVKRREKRRVTKKRKKK